MSTTKQTKEGYEDHPQRGAQIERCEKRWQILIGSLENELKEIKKAHTKRDPTNTQDAVTWHIQENMITWLGVHIKMMKGNAYNPKED